MSSLKRKNKKTKSRDEETDVIYPKSLVLNTLLKHIPYGKCVPVLLEACPLNISDNDKIFRLCHGQVLYEAI